VRYHKACGWDGQALRFGAGRSPSPERTLLTQAVPIREAEGVHGVWEEQNKATFRRYVEEVGNEGKLDLVEEIFDSYLSHQPDGHAEERGPEDVERFIGEFRQAFPDFHTTIEEQIADGDKVVTCWTMRGTQHGEFRGIVPTGEQIMVRGIGIFRFSEEGKVVESWDNLDQLGMMG
jgi:predicted ester cyclase